MSSRQLGKTIDVLIATYNGEKYIRAQLLSLLCQSYSDIRVIVHDDGSTDKTVEILRKIASIDKRVILVEDGVTLGSAARNFMHVLKYSESDAVMFCDQDDIWFDNKVEAMFDQLKRKNNSIPQVVYSESYVWYSDSGVDGFAFKQRPKNLREFLFIGGGIQGCASIFNAKMRNLMLLWQGNLVMHDYVLALLGLSLGEVTFLLKPLMLYRRHENTVTARNKNVSWKERLYRNREIPVVSAKHYETVERFKNIYGTQLKGTESKNILERYLSMKKESFLQRLMSIIQYQFKIYDSCLILLIKLFLRPYYRD